MRLCSVYECESKHLAKTYCTKHYYRFKRHGDPSIAALPICQTKQYESLQDRFENNIEIITETGCWIWFGKVDRDGYGIMNQRENGKVMGYRSHRYAYTQYVGKIPNGICVCHSCDIPSCCNPKHLFLGTHKQNISDKINKKRQASGSRIKSAKFNAIQVRDIRMKLSRGQSAYSIAKSFDVAPSTIHMIKNNITWKGV